jgi:hypothetical protein
MEEEDVLLSWHELQKLGIISPEVPQNREAAAVKGGAGREKAGARSCDKATGRSSVDRTEVPQNLEAMKRKFADVLGTTLDEAAGAMKGEKMKIHLKEGHVKPLSVTTARQVPMHFTAMADKLVAELVKSKVLVAETGPTAWCSPAHFVPKPGGKKLRLVTDYRELNKSVIRTMHPFPSAADLVKHVQPSSQFFAKIDTIHGYFQVPLDEESSKLTTFLLPSGRYRYLGAPMGLNTSGDEFCCRTDKAVAGLQAWLLKIVDDMLIQAPDMPTLWARLDEVLERCRAHGIKISYDKLEVGTSLKFAGFIISSDGVRPNPEKLAAVADFPAPTNTTELRGFLGLVNQLGIFVPDISHMTVTMRQLLKKGNAYLWLECHQQEFVRAKAALTSPMVVQPFDPSLPTELLTDASRLYGIGFALVQHDFSGRLRLVSCGSRSLTPCQQNYATIELECMAIKWAVEKCEYYLRGIRTFNVVTDHKPLIGIFAKPLHELANERLHRFREKLTDYNFEVTWTPGKEHLIADALSRAPVFPGEEDEDAERSRSAMCKKVTSDPALQPLFAHAARDPFYRALVDGFRAGADPAKVPALRAFGPVWAELSLLDDRPDTLLVYQDTRIVVPLEARKKILALLHASHSGMAKTYQNARQLYYWPGMKQAISQTVQGCAACLARLPSLPLETLRERSVPEGPMSHVGIDLFEFRGADWLLMVDRYSGFPFCHPLKSTVTASITGALLLWFCEFGFPKVIRSDGGPQFRQKFKDFCEKHGIVHELSSPYNPRANGLAEAGVKNVKKLLGTVRALGEHFPTALLAWRNTPRADGVSPAQAFFGRRQRTALPQVEAEAADGSPNFATFGEIRKSSKDKIVEKCNLKLRDLNSFQVGDDVLIQHPTAKTWESAGVISSVHEDGRSYDIIVSDSGKTFRRNRRYLRHDTSAPRVADGADDRSPPPALVPALRRSKRRAADSALSRDKDNSIVPTPRRSVRIAEGLKQDTKKISFAKRVLVKYF